jgi:hypothetical protein
MLQSTFHYSVVISSLMMESVNRLVEVKKK